MVGVQVGMKDGATVGIGDGGEVGLNVKAALGDLVGLAVGVRVLGACENTKLHTDTCAIIYIKQYKYVCVYVCIHACIHGFSCI